MSNVRIIFEHSGLWLLLIIPAVVIALIPYFRLSKKYRRTRNRIISLTLHIIIMVLSISMLSGISIAYDKPNPENEMIILVDVSYSGNTTKADKDDFVRRVLDSNKMSYKIGIVNFARTPKLVADFSYDMEAIYNRYINASTTEGNDASNIAEGLLFAKSQFTTPRTGKVLLLTDGNQTDGDALVALMSLIGEGVKVDTVYFGDTYSSEIQILGVTTPPTIVPDVETNIEVGIAATFEGIGSITIYDNGNPTAPQPIMFTPETTSIPITHTFSGNEEAHQLRFELRAGNDTIEENNTYYAYVQMKVFDNVLIIDRFSEGNKLEQMINTTFSSVTKMDLADVPVNLAALSNYEQIILVNIGNNDMPDGLDAVLHDYVYELGGGLLTVGGNKRDDNGEFINEPNVYNEEDMNPLVDPDNPFSKRQASIYQEMLPVQCISYYPPIAVVLLIDRSGSMEDSDRDGTPKIDIVKKAAIEALDVLSERDYVSVVGFSTHAEVKVPMTAVPQKSKLKSAINSLSPSGTTNYGTAIDTARRQLIQFSTKVKNKHIILISDGAPQDSPTGNYGYITAAYRCFDDGITLSVMSIVVGGEDGFAVGQQLVSIAGGNAYELNNIHDLAGTIEKDLSVDEIRGYNQLEEPFQPFVGDRTWIFFDIEEELIPTLDGYYGVKAKGDVVKGNETIKVSVPLLGEFTPIYAEWQYGQGKVGSIMTDLYGNWSGGFFGESVTAKTGQKLIENIIKSLLPTSSIELRDKSKVALDNYSAYVEMTTDTSNGEYVMMSMEDVTVGAPDSLYQEVRATISGNIASHTFQFQRAGMYKIVVQKFSSTGIEVGNPFISYTPFNYSAEYHIVPQTKKLTGEELLNAMVGATGGNKLSMPASDSAQEVFVNTSVGDVEKTVPIIIAKYLWITFVILIIVMFLLDIAVRKFKFKWPWEIIRDRKERKRLHHR